MNSDIAIINDTHFGIRNDSIYFLDKSLEYFETVVFPYIIKNDIKNIIHLGDFFDRRKYINLNTLKVFQYSIYLLESPLHFDL